MSWVEENKIKRSWTEKMKILIQTKIQGKFQKQSDQGYEDKDQGRAFTNNVTCLLTKSKTKVGTGGGNEFNTMRK